MIENVVWERKSDNRFTIKVITTPNWKGGIPKNPNIPKYLVKIEDALMGRGYCPTDAQFQILPSIITPSAAKDIIEAFKFKEEHNRKNLKNPERRKKEEILKEMLESYRRFWGYEK